MPNYRLPGGLAQITVNGNTYRADRAGLVTATGADAAAIAGAGGLVDGGIGGGPEWSLDATGTADGLIGPDGTKATGNTAIAAAALAGGIASSLAVDGTALSAAYASLANANTFASLATFSAGIQIATGQKILLGGATSSFPAIQRDGTSNRIQIVKGDGSDYTVIQAYFKSAHAYTAGVTTATGYLYIYDSNNTQYKLLVST